MKESELIAEAKKDKDAFGQIYELYVDRIFNYVYYRVGNRADAEDLTSKIFFRALQHIGKYEDQGVPFSAWLYRIARNLVANWYRDQSRRRTVALDDVVQWLANDEGPELSAEWNEHESSLVDAVRRLPAERQEMLILKFLDRQSNAEIGRIMGRSEGAIKSLYHRTLISLRQEMQPKSRPSALSPFALLRRRGRS